MNRSNVFKLVLAVALLGVATFMLVRFLRQGDGVSEQTFFYDLSEKKLFAASREALPPIRGLNNAEEDAVRAVVIAYNGNPKDKASRKIAYLEKYAPEFKVQLEKVRAGQAEPLARDSRNTFRFVKRVEDADWHTVSSPDGEKILTEWNVAGPDGKFPAVCVP
ncbi:MAG: hypothetical protein HOP33_03035 [Verrucomicrobia bacterium]|nr:hypothetical protein [Verrucomicrobiota bacterium]